MERAMLAHPAILWLIDTDLGAPNGYGTKMRPRKEHGPLSKSQHHVIDSTNLCRALNYSIQDRLHVCRRAADDTEHFGGRRLMLQGLAKLRVALLDLLEQSYVLNSNYGLGSESFEERDMFLREGT